MISAGLIHEAQHSKPLFWDNSEGWGGEEGFRIGNGNLTAFLICQALRWILYSQFLKLKLFHVL